MLHKNLLCSLIILAILPKEFKCDNAIIGQKSTNNSKNNSSNNDNNNNNIENDLVNYRIINNYNDNGPAASLAQNASILAHAKTINNTSAAVIATKADDDKDSSPLDEFPEYFNEDQLRQGWVALHVFAAFYFFVFLATLCKDYFLPTVECICEDLNLSKDVAAATFMAVATSMPEFFTNTISTLITDSDMGLGTIIGSLIFNTLGVGGLAALAIKKPIQLDWWPIARDCCLYGFNILVLFAVAFGGIMTFTGSCIMMGFLVFYFLISFNSSRVMPAIRSFFEETLNCCRCGCCRFLNEITPTTEEFSNDKAEVKEPNDSNIYTIANIPDDSSAFASSQANIINPDEKVLFKQPRQLFSLPHGKSKFRQFWWAFTFPIRFVLTFTVPNPATHRKLYPLSFIMCVIGIGLNAYMIVWMLTAFGVAIRVPEIVMGLTFLAAGSNMPEAVSSIISLRNGESGIGVSNSLGANSLAILLSLGVPWFIKNCMNYNKPDGQNYIVIAAQGIEYSIGILLVSTLALFVVLSCSGYRLTKIAGISLLGVYAILISTEVLLEMNIFFPKV